MKHYEVVLLVHPDQNDQVGAMMERYRSMLTSAGGVVHHTEDWGRRQLASMVRKVHKARYLLMSIECGTDALNDLKQVLRFNDAVLRHMVIVRDGPLSEVSALAREKKERDHKMKTRARSPRKETEAEDTQEAATAEVETDESTASSPPDTPQEEPQQTATTPSASSDAEPSASSDIETPEAPETPAETAEADTQTQEDPQS